MPGLVHIVRREAAADGCIVGATVHINITFRVGLCLAARCRDNIFVRLLYKLGIALILNKTCDSICNSAALLQLFISASSTPVDCLHFPACVLDPQLASSYDTYIQ